MTIRSKSDPASTSPRNLAAGIQVPSVGPRGRFSKNIELWVGGTILCFIAIVVIGAPIFAQWNPTEQNLQSVLSGPSGEHWLGTDQLGRDIFSRLLYGGQIDLGISLISVAIPFIFGSLVGAIAGFFGGWLDNVIMRLADIVAVFPFYVLVIVLVFAIGGGPLSVVVAISMVSWVSYARIVRAQTLVIRGREFIDACRSGGLGSFRIITRHILPNTVPQAVIYAMSDIVLNIGVIVTLSYFGLGIAPPTADWGRMISEGQQFLASGRYDLVLVPAVAVIVTSLGLTLVGDGIARRLRGNS